MISVVINCDNRVGYMKPESTVGDFGTGSLQGVRSVDFLLEGVKNKMNYFRDYECQCILYIDKHQDFHVELMQEIESIVYSYGNNSKIVLVPHSKSKNRWNDHLYIDALKLAEGGYVVHFDQDCNAYRTDESDIIERYLTLLDNGYKYICQPWNGIGDKMEHASTRFFICKKETLESAFKVDLLVNPLRGVHSPCLEHALGVLAGAGTVLYPPREDDEYIVFSWARYYQGTLKKLNEMKPIDAINYVLGLGISGANDCLDKNFYKLLYE